MNNKFKKGALALGTIATIAAPVAAVVSCGATANTINWDDNQLFGGVKGSDFISEIKHLGKAKQNAITVGREQMMQLQYESESIRSLTAQLDDFKYQNWQTEMENAQHEYDQEQTSNDKDAYMASITSGGVVDEDKKDQSIIDGFDDKIKGYEDAVKDNEEKIEDKSKLINKLQDVLSKLSLSGEYLQDKDDAVKNFYANDYNSSDYPEVFKPITSIKEEKTSYVEDAYKNFYPQFNTRDEGEREWPNELASKFGGAATFDQAIDYLVTQEVSSKAFNSYKFEINKGFDVEKMLWAKYVDTDSYKFLANASTSVKQDELDLIGTDKTSFEENILKIKRGDEVSTGKIVKASKLSSTVLFIGSTSPDHRMPASAYTDLGKVVKYQHLLIKATKGKTPEEIWTIATEDLKKLMAFNHYNDGSKDTVGQGIDSIINEKLFDDDKFTDFVLGSVSGNSAGTTKIQGSLGIKSETEYLKEMVPGFSLGALALTEGISKTYDAVADLPTGSAAKSGDKALVGTNDGKILYKYNGSKWVKVTPDIDLTSLINKLKAALVDAVKDDYPTFETPATTANIDNKNTEMGAVFTTLGDDKVKAIFGKVFKEELGSLTQGLVYHLTGSKDKFLVVSQFGIHIIKRTSYDDEASITAAINSDLENMAEDSSLSSSTSIVAELNSSFTETKIMDTLLKTSYKEDGKDVFPYKVALKAKLDKYNEGKTDAIDKVEISDIEDVITSINKLKSKSDVDGAMGDKLENWLVSQLDAGLRTLDSDLELSDIYKWAQLAEKRRS